MAANKFKHLLSPIKLGDLELKNRVIMASMTRNRNLVPQQINVDYYTERANAGLILSEGTLVAQQGTQWPDAPGIYTEEQTEGWKKVVDSVHKAGGVIFLQVRSLFPLCWMVGIDADGSYGMLEELHIRVTNSKKQQESPSLVPAPSPPEGDPSMISPENPATLLPQQLKTPVPSLKNTRKPLEMPKKPVSTV